MQDPGVRGRLGEGGVVLPGPADERAAGAAPAGGEEISAPFPVQPSRARHAAYQPVRTVAAVEAIGAEAALDQIVLGPAFDRVVAESAGDANVLGALQRPIDDEAVVPRSEVGHDPAGQAFRGAAHLRRPVSPAPGADRDALARPDAEGRSRFVE